METHRTCPLCETQVLLNDYPSHLMSNHFETLLTYLTINMDPMTYLEHQLDSTIDQMGYEDLLELCNTIGYHKVGILDISTIASMIETPKEETCPICLEEWKNRSIYQTHRCRHEFCQPCLETWIQDHKTCPMCHQDLDSK